MDLHWPKIKVTTIPPALGTTGETLRVANRESSRAEAGGQGQVSHWGCWLTAHTHTPAIGCPLEIAKTPVSYQPGWRNAWQTAEEVFKAVSCPVSLTPAGRAAGMCLRALPPQHEDGSGCFVAGQISPTAPWLATNSWHFACPVGLAIRKTGFPSWILAERISPKRRPYKGSPMLCAPSELLVSPQALLLVAFRHPSSTQIGAQSQWKGC